MGQALAPSQASSRANDNGQLQLQLAIDMIDGVTKTAVRAPTKFGTRRREGGKAGRAQGCSVGPPPYCQIGHYQVIEYRIIGVKIRTGFGLI